MENTEARDRVFRAIKQRGWILFLGLALAVVVLLGRSLESRVLGPGSGGSVLATGFTWAIDGATLIAAILLPAGFAYLMMAMTPPPKPNPDY